MPRAILSLLVLAALGAFGCNRSEPQPSPGAAPGSQDSPSAPPAAPLAGSPASPGDTALVTQAIQEHLRDNKGINLSAMDMTVDSVAIDGDRAQANATFRVRGGGATMEMVYSLERHGAGWLVLKSHPSNGEFVHPPMDSAHSGAAAPASPTPPGTPDVTDFLKNQPAPKSN